MHRDTGGVWLALIAVVAAGYLAIARPSPRFVVEGLWWAVAAFVALGAALVALMLLGAASRARKPESEE